MKTIKVVLQVVVAAAAVLLATRTIQFLDQNFLFPLITTLSLVLIEESMIMHGHWFLFKEIICLSLIPLFDGKEIDEKLCILRSHFKRLTTDIGATGDTFYVHILMYAFSMVGVSFEVRLLLPMKSLGYEVPSYSHIPFLSIFKCQKLC